MINVDKMNKSVALPSPSAKKTEEYTFVPPDGGWGWVIVFTAFYCVFVVDGITFSAGIFLPKIAEYFKVSKATASLLWSLSSGVRYLAGPVTAAAMQTLGVRVTAFIGAILVTLVLGSLSLDLPLWLLALEAGIIGGIGMCFVFMSALGITCKYFTTLRIYALGITNCGTGLGTIVFAFLDTYLLSTMSWQSSYLVLAGFSSLLLPLVLTFAPLESVKIELTEHLKLGAIISQKTTKLAGIGQQVDEDTELDEDDNNIVVYNYMNNKTIRTPEDTRDPSRSSLAQATAFAERAYDYMVLFDLADQMDRRRIRRHVQGQPWWKICCQTRKSLHRKLPRKTVVIKMHPATKQAMFERRNAHGELQMTALQRREGQFKVFMRKVLDFNALKQPGFFCYCLSGSCISTAVLIVYTYESGRIDSDYNIHGLEKTRFLALLGASNTFWRLFLGFISHSTMVSYKTVYILATTITGVTVIFSSYVCSLYYHVYYCVMVGFAHACYAVYKPAMLAEFFGIARLANASGVSLMFIGVLMIAGPPFSGYLLHINGDEERYDIVFWLAGGLFILSALLFVPFAYITRHHQLPTSNP